MTIRLKKPLVYVTRDIERALGLEPGGMYFVISNNTEYGREIKKQYPENVWLIDTKPNGELLDTFELLSLPLVGQAILEHKADVLVFKNTGQIERLSKERGWNLLNPRAYLSKMVEEKISQVAWLKKDANLLPPHKITLLKKVKYDKKKFILQFNHSHTGEGTYIIDSLETLEDLKEKFPERECRIVNFIDGPVLTLNIVVGFWTLLGSPSYQITGLKPFTDLPLSTIGNDWSLPLSDEFTDTDIKRIKDIAKKIARRMRFSGWKGLFGIDLIKDSLTSAMYLLEINARQPASVSYESKLQSDADFETTIFDAHIASILGKSFPLWRLKTISGGAQIIQRITKKQTVFDTKKLETKLGVKNCTVIPYEKGDYNKEYYRIQSEKGVMEGHDKFNELGNFISSCIQQK